MRYKEDNDNRYRVNFMRATEELMDALTVESFISYLEENAEFEDNTVEYIDGKCVKCRAYDLTEENSKLHKEFLVTEDGRVFYWRTLLDKIELVDDEIPVGRAERRRLEREKSKQKTATYNLTKEQLDKLVEDQIKDRLKAVKKQAMEDAINTAMTLLLVLPMEVLMDHYWKKTYAKKIPEFTELVLQYYERWQNGELDMDEMKKDLWEYGGVRLEEREAE